MKTYKSILRQLFTIKGKMVFLFVLVLSPINKLFNQKNNDKNSAVQYIQQKSMTTTSSYVNISSNDTIPKGLKYTTSHEWVKIEGDTALIGITDYGQTEIGEIVFIEVDTVNEILEKDEMFGTTEALKTTSEMFMPLTGKVLEFNKTLNEIPELINSDPYGKGWIIKIKLTKPEEIKQLLNAEQYTLVLNKQ